MDGRWRKPLRRYDTELHLEFTSHRVTGFWDLGHKLFRTTPETTELRGHISVIYPSFFHLFNEEKQLEVGQRPETFTKAVYHSPESRTRVWEEGVFGKGQAKVNTILKEPSVTADWRVVPVGGGTGSHWLAWSVERL